MYTHSPPDRKRRCSGRDTASSTAIVRRLKFRVDRVDRSQPSRPRYGLETGFETKIEHAANRTLSATMALNTILFAVMKFPQAAP